MSELDKLDKQEKEVSKEVLAHYVANLEFNTNISDEWFLDACAMKVAAGIASEIADTFPTLYPEVIATNAYDIAKAMLAERNKRRGNPNE